VTITAQSVQQYIGKTLFDDTGNKIGKIGTIFLDDVSGEPEWITVSTGFFGTNESFVPISGASAREDGLSVPHSKDKIKNAPNVDVEQGHLSTDEEAELYQYYGLDYSSTQAGDQGTRYSGTTTGRDTTRDVGDTDTGYTDTGDRGTGYNEGANRQGDDAMTRSEERLNVGKETVPTGKARLRKWVETEQQQVEVPVRKEKVRLESEPITDANQGQAYSGPDISEDEHEVTIREERPVVETEAVPVERVRLATETEEETRTVGGEVRKEKVDLDADENVDRRR
jgi:uncharacterized protein (TIGR02271 family)